MSRAEIRRAVVAVGGRGTKMAPMNRLIAKEMLPVGRRPILEHLVLELRDAGIDKVLFVISSRKSEIPAYFGSGESYDLDISYRVQDDGDGPGAPVLAAEAWTRDEPFVLAFGDNLIRPSDDTSDTPLQRLVNDHTGACSVLTQVFPVEGLPPHETLLGAAAAPGPDAPSGASVFCADHLDDRTALWVHACAARWVLSGFVFEALRRCRRRDNGELYLIDAVRQWIGAGQHLRAVPLFPTDLRFNIDNWGAYEDAVTRLRT